MKPFVINRHGRIVFPFNFFPDLDFSVFDTLEQFSAVIKRDFEEKAPTEGDIVTRLREDQYHTRFEVCRDLALDLFWVNRYAMTMYEKRPMRWRDVPRRRDDVFLPVYRPWDVNGSAAAIEAGYYALPAQWDQEAEDRSFHILLDVFRHKPAAGKELPAIKPTVAEILRDPECCTLRLMDYDPDFPRYGYEEILDCTHSVPEIEALLRPVPVESREDYPGRGGKAPRRRLRGDIPSAESGGVAIHPPGESRRPRAAPTARPPRDGPAGEALSSRGGPQALRRYAPHRGAHCLRGRDRLHQ
jgi:hypothetical protein